MLMLIIIPPLVEMLLVCNYTFPVFFNHINTVETLVLGGASAQGLYRLVARLSRFLSGHYQCISYHQNVNLKLPVFVHWRFQLQIDAMEFYFGTSLEELRDQQFVLKKIKHPSAFKSLTRLITVSKLDILLSRKRIK